MVKMKMNTEMKSFTSCFYIFALCISPINVAYAGDSVVVGNTPFSPRAYLHRYWKKLISNNFPEPQFLIDKASPLTAVESAAFTQFAGRNTLFTHLPSFCSAAGLFCLPDPTPDLEKHDGFSLGFDTYNQKNFTNYGTNARTGDETFTSYSPDNNVVVDSFRRYSHGATARTDRFTNYATRSNVVDQSFNSYAGENSGGDGHFTNYNTGVNVPDLKFTTYSAHANGQTQSFTTYTRDANHGNETFTSYGRTSNGSPNEFTLYGNNSNVISSDFSSYGQLANSPNQTFISYGSNGNNPDNNFRSYGDGGNSPFTTFINYRDNANVGDDSFQSYGKNSNAAPMQFSNYGQTVNGGSDSFKGYGKGSAEGQTIGFTVYGSNTTFRDYGKEGITFNKYNESSSSTELASKGKSVNRWVEPGKFFRENMLLGGNILAMPDIVDRMPKRSFLPRVISSKIPFSTSKLSELKRTFHAGDSSSMAAMLASALSECERAPSKGETKKCVGSIEDMMDFATTVLGRNVVVRTTENTKGSKHKVMIGSIKKINGGKITKSVSCHQIMYPYLLYYCHSVPEVRVYEADILDPKSKGKINHGVAICHVDTSSWSANHGAFVALGSGPGRIEVCHWIFENDMTWVVAD